MKTSELIDTLCETASPAPRRAPGLMVAGASVGGALLALILVGLLLGFRPMSEAVRSSSFWMKAGYTTALALCGWALASRLARPEGEGSRALIATGLVVALLWVAAAMEMGATPPALWRQAVMGTSWRMCSMRILLLSIPAFAAAILVLRRLAPTRLRLAGAAAGLLAGGVGASVYGLYCQETAAVFTAAWYTLGIAVCAAVGALVGPRLLRW